jgi:hypothetical protein
MLKTRLAQIIALLIALSILISGASFISGGILSGSKSTVGKNGDSASATSVYELVAGAAGTPLTHRPISNFSKWILTTDTG